MLVRAAAAAWKVAPATAHGRERRRHPRQAPALLRRARRDGGDAARVARDRRRSRYPRTGSSSAARSAGSTRPRRSPARPQFGIDVHFPGLRTAVVARPPAFGAQARQVRRAPRSRVARRREGRARPPNGVAVVAKHFWAAKLGRDALDVEWTQPEGGGVDSDSCSPSSARSGATARAWSPAGQGRRPRSRRPPRRSSRPSTTSRTSRTRRWSRSTAAVKIDGDTLRDLAGTQFQTVDQMARAKIVGTTPDKVTIHTTFLGGGFGRRAQPRTRLRRRGGARREGRRRPGQGRLDARGRHARRLLPADVRAPHPGRPRRQGPAPSRGITSSSASRSSPARRSSRSGQERHRRLARSRASADSPYLETRRRTQVTLHSPNTPSRCSGGARSATRTRRSRWRA